jgi:hypothetical protein
LLGIIKHHTKDPDQLERMWGQSALGRREKFRSRPDYRRRTINFVLGDDKAKPQDEVHSRSHSLGDTGMGTGTNENEPPLPAENESAAWTGAY